MRKCIAPLAGGLLLLLAPVASAQDVMSYEAKQWTVLDENDQARVLRFAPKKGEKTPVHTHPVTIVYVVKGGKLRITRPDGTAEVTEYPTGKGFIRAAETHADEALDSVELILVELKR